ncbi:unnamed protein product [Penicillium glandicola]
MPSRSTKRAYSEPAADPEESVKKRRGSLSSDFSSDEAESHLLFALEDHEHVDYSVMAQTCQEEATRPQRQQRWTHRGSEPINDPALVPKGWKADELDLDVNDIDAQVERCMERINDGILPNFFKFRLSQYEKRRAARDEMVHSEPAGLSWDIVRRLDHLKAIEAHLDTNGDPDNQLPNVRALMKAYREGKLGWSRGWVSYWSKGVQVNTPQPFDADYHRKLAREHDTTREWWVEGLQAPAGASLGGFHAFAPYTGAHTVAFPVEVSANSQLPGVNSLTLYVCHDTGADFMAIPQCYIDQVESLGIAVPVHGYNIMDTPGGWSCHKVVELDVRITDGTGNSLCHWMRVQACVLASVPGDHFGMLLSGPFLRFALYTATCPDGQGNLYVCKHKKELRQIPAIPENFVPTGPPYMHTSAPAPGGGPPPQFVLEQTRIMTPMATQPPPLQPPQPAKTPAKKGKKKGKKGAAP